MKVFYIKINGKYIPIEKAAGNKTYDEVVNDR